jgi:predicted peptidase
LATPGTWTQATYQQMPYYVLLPDGYNAATSYPVVLFLHQYQNDSGQPAQTDPWFNTAAFRAAHPASSWCRYA